MKGARSKEGDWYRRNWKTVATVWGLFLALIAVMGAVLWFAVIRHSHDSRSGPPHVHVPTSLQVVEPSSDYPLTTCVVSGKPLRPFPDRVAVICDGVQVQFCCENCIAPFEKDAEKYLAIVRAAPK